MIRNSWCVKRYDRRHGAEIPTDHMTLVEQLDAARSAILSLGDFGNEPAYLGEAERVKLAFEILNGIDELLPKVECWCVVKHYTNGWEPRVWCGCTTESQAAEFAPA